jgi:hypothetical protein
MLLTGIPPSENLVYCLPYLRTNHDGKEGLVLNGAVWLCFLRPA